MDSVLVTSRLTTMLVVRSSDHDDTMALSRNSAVSFLCGATTSLAVICLYQRLKSMWQKYAGEKQRPSTSHRLPPHQRSAEPNKEKLLDRPDLDLRLIRKAEAVIQGRTDRLIIVVERCTNDHNYSAILRTAEALGIQHCWIIDPPVALDDDDVERKNVVKTKSGTHVRLTVDEAEERAKHRLFARNAQEWLTVRTFSSSSYCLEALREKGYTVWVTDLSQEAESLSDLAPPLPEKVAIVMGTEAVGCSQLMLDGADLRVYLPMVGFAGSIEFID